MSLPTASEDAKRAFVTETDEVDRRSQAEGAGADAASDLAALRAEHERDCAALSAQARSETGHGGAAE